MKAPHDKLFKYGKLRKKHVRKPASGWFNLVQTEECTSADPTIARYEYLRFAICADTNLIEYLDGMHEDMVDEKRYIDTHLS